MQPVIRLIEQFIPDNYQLSLNLKRNEREFDGTVSIFGTVLNDSGNISLHAKDLTIKEVTVNGKHSNYSYRENDELLISNTGVKSGEHVIVITFSGTITDAMHGLYPCYFEHDGQKKELLATQFESHHAREVFPCVDEPEAKAIFDLTLSTEQNVVVLGNQPIEWQRTENELLVTCFQTTPRMSTYLLAWVVGELHHKTATTKSGVEVSVWATPAQRPEALDFALEHSVKSIEFFDEYFNTPYPLAKCDQVALPDFSSGAMENWGLVTYRETALLADPTTTTVASKHYIATVISHELSHQWFGNLVTMKWWNNLWLNESFATLMEYIAVDAIHPEWNAWLDFSSHETIMALRRDAIDGIQPVQVDVYHPDEIQTLFDGAIVYAKGARLMRMCQELIGHEAFKNGLASYFEEFAYKNTDEKDLWAHLSRSSGQDIESIMRPWISESGYPVVHVSDNSIRQEQFFIGPHEESSKIWPIPLNCDPSENMPLLLDDRETPVPIKNALRFNVNDASHFITHYPSDHLASLIGNLGSINPIGRLQLLHEQSLLARGGILSSAELIPLLYAYKEEHSQSVWDVISLTLRELRKFVEEDENAERKLRAFTSDLSRAQYERLGWNPVQNESESDTKLRSLMISLMLYGEDSSAERRCHELYEGGIDNIDSELRHLAIGTAVKYAQHESIIQHLLEKHRTTQSADLRDDICAGLTSVRNESYVPLILESLTDSDVIRRQDVFRWFAYLMRNRFARDATWQWMTENWEWIENTYAGDKSYDSFPQYAAAGIMNEVQLEKFKQFFNPKLSIPALTRAIDLGIKEIEGRLTLLKTDGDAVRSALLKLS